MQIRAVGEDITSQGKVINMKKIVPLILSALLSTSVFNYIIKPPSFFNFLPFAIHENFFRGIVGERLFIIVFDLLFAILLFFVFNKVFKKINI